MPQFNKKSLFVSLLVCLPLAANAECLMFNSADWSGRPTGIPDDAIDISDTSDYAYEGEAQCASGTTTFNWYYDSELNIFKRILSCGACPSGAIKINRSTGVGSCTFHQPSQWAYYCEKDAAQYGKYGVYKSLPSGGVLEAGTMAVNCAMGDSDYGNTYYVKVTGDDSDNRYYYGQSCYSCVGGYRPVYYPYGGAYARLFIMSCEKCANGYGVSLLGDNDYVGCKQCQAGYYSLNNIKCVQTDPGYYTDLDGAPRQFACPIGSYNTGTGNTSCTPCTNGQTTTGTASTYCDATCANADGVTNWATATWSNDSVDNLCTPKGCKLGYGWSSESGTCKLCGFGKYKSTTGLEVCQSCPASDVYINEGQTVQQVVTTPSLGATSRSECQVGTTTFKFYNETGRYFYPDIYACSIDGVADDTAGDDCDSVVPLCLTAGGNTGTIQDSIPSGAIVGGGNCWCRSNNKFLQGPNMSNVDTCNENCPAYCGTTLDEGTTVYSEIGCDTDTVSCDSVGGACRATDATWSYMQPVSGSSPYYSEFVPTGQYCWCGINGYSFVAANMNATETCEAACPNYCVNLLTDSDYISQYNLPSQVGCSN